MEVLQFVYNDKTIDFSPAGDDNVMVNATQMANLFGREMKDFNKLDSTKRFINSCLISDFSSLIGVEKKEDLIISRQNSGTWMHRVLALKFAAWLDPFFEVWIYSTIDKIILGHYKEQKEATQAKLQAEIELEEKKKELAEKYPEFAEYLSIESKIKEAGNRRQKALREGVKQLRLALVY